MPGRQPARADVVGSLLRPPDLDGREDDAIRDVVRRQIDTGLDIVTDGELRRSMFQCSFWDALAGYTTDRNPVTFRGDDGSTVTWHVHRIEDRLRRLGTNPAADEARFLADAVDYPFKVTFPAASLFALPFTFKPGINDHAYADLDELVAHCVELESELVREAVAAGARAIQFDFPAYPYLVDPTWLAAVAETGWTPAQVLDLAVAADTAVREAVPPGIPVALHVCRGNNQSRYLCEGALDPVADAMFALPYDSFLVEWEDPSRMGDFGALGAVPQPGPVVVLGIVSSKTPELETLDEVCGRIDEAAGHLPLDQLAVSTQCGFASTSPGNAISEDDQWRKLQLVADVADRVWGR